MTEAALIVCLLLLAALVAWLLFVQLPDATRLRTDLATAQSEREGLTRQLAKAETELSGLRQQSAALAGAEARVSTLADQLNRALAEAQKAAAERDHYGRKVAELQVTLGEANKAFETERATLIDMQRTFKDQFDALTKGLIDANSQKFLEQNKSTLDPLLAPLRQQLETFQKKVEEVYTGERAQLEVLLKSVERVETSSKALDADAQRLTSALLGQSKVQGDWGEVVLEQLLQSLGLIEGTHYEQQSTYTGEGGERLRPDFVLRFPDGRRVVVDAKVSLTAYTQWTAAADEPTRRNFLKQHLDSVKGHIDELAARSYATVEGLKGPKVVMFVAVEPAYIEAVRAEPTLYTTAFKKGVILATQSSLYTVLATLEYTWRQQDVNRNAEEIARQAGALYDKFADFVKDLERLGKQLKTAQGSYDDAWTKLTGKGSLVTRAEGMLRLGVPTKKTLPSKALFDAELIDEAVDEAPTPAAD